MDANFNRQWAEQITGSALETLRREMKTGGKEIIFNSLKSALTGGTRDRTQVAAELGMSDGAVKVAVHRLRARYRKILRSTIGQTVAEASEIDDEMRELIRALSSPP